MLNSDSFLVNGCMMNVSHEKMKHPEWEIQHRYCFVGGKEYGNCVEKPVSIIKRFLGNDYKSISIRAFTEAEIRTIPMTRHLRDSDRKRALKSAYNVCMAGIGCDDYIDVHVVGPYECLQFWHLTDDGRPRWDMEAVRDTRNGNLYVCICGVFKRAH